MAHILLSWRDECLRQSGDSRSEKHPRVGVPVDGLSKRSSDVPNRNVSETADRTRRRHPLGSGRRVGRRFTVKSSLTVSCASTATVVGWIGWFLSLARTRILPVVRRPSRGRHGGAPRGSVAASSSSTAMGPVVALEFPNHCFMLLSGSVARKRRLCSL